jgi:uncharacterized repeat protein (TIGR01451 family)
MKRAMAAVIMAVLMVIPATVRAQQKGSIELKSVAEVEVVGKNEKGEKVVTRKDASLAKIVPGDTVIYTTAYRNVGRQQATAVVITNPVPEGTVYLDRTADGKGARIEFSLDGGRTYAAADTLVVKDPSGAARMAGPSDYTYIKWTLTKPVPAGGKGSVSFRVKIK